MLGYKKIYIYIYITKNEKGLMSTEFFHQIFSFKSDW